MINLLDGSKAVWPDRKVRPGIAKNSSIVATPLAPVDITYSLTLFLTRLL